MKTNNYMQEEIRDAALGLGFIDARPVTGHPFEVWRKRLSSIPLGQHMSFDHDPVAVSGWPLEEITLWAAVAETPPFEDWPEDCGEIGAYYMCSDERAKRDRAWEEAVVKMGYEIAYDFMLPERAAAIRAGLGVHGLNGLLITPDHGSFVSTSLLLIHAAPPPDARGPEHDLSPGCGNCGVCIKACPTGAISTDGVNTVICLRTYMSHPEHMPEDDYSKMDKRILGCDTCQHVCPKNNSVKRIKPSDDVTESTKIEKLLTDASIEKMLQTTKIRHSSVNDVKRQAVLAAANTGRKDLLPVIESLAACEDKYISKFARWASDSLMQG